MLFTTQQVVLITLCMATITGITLALLYMEHSGHCAGSCVNAYSTSGESPLQVFVPGPIEHGRAMLESRTLQIALIPPAKV